MYMYTTENAREFLSIQNLYCYIRRSHLLSANIVNQNSYQIYETSPLPWNSSSITCMNSMICMYMLLQKVYSTSHDCQFI